MKAETEDFSYFIQKADTLIKAAKSDSSAVIKTSEKKTQDTIVKKNKEKNKTNTELNPKNSSSVDKNSETINKKTVINEKNIESIIPNDTLNVNQKFNVQFIPESNYVYVKFNSLENDSKDSLVISKYIAAKNLMSSLVTEQNKITYPLLNEIIHEQVIEYEKITDEKKTWVDNMIQPTSSIFYPHLLKIKNPSPIFIHKKENGVSFSVIVICLLILAALNVIFYKRFQLFKKALFNNRIAGQIIREENILNYRIIGLLNVMFLFIGTLFIHNIGQHYNWYPEELSQMNTYLITFAGFSGYFGLKYILNKLSGYLFLVEKEIKEYLFNVFLFHQFWAVLLLGFVSVFAFNTLFSKDLLVYSGLGLYIMLYIYQIVRSLPAAINNKRISNLYLFFYFCTLEILPLVIVSKIVE